ncbi:sugar dehydrogenase complex small subunit [Sodalis sp. dw_96]|uniref:sugar dehydrogenase complex small subunit n=1 Tax=Sodalis sp. dw_96 TaxID=2719794 RepID=UPI001BD54D4A|nr:sugar dehydrogenase complex small subunit [Sodalis sp. dw_96]
MTEKNNPPASVTRRRILQGIGVLSLGALCSSLFPILKVRAQELKESGFIPVSSFLVSRQVSPLLSRRYYNVLIKHYPDFPARLTALGGYINSHHFAHVDDFLASLSQDDALRQTATLIISAWYTGVVGEDEHLELIAYAEAMMYLPTKGILVVPTYGGGPDSWGSKPIDPPSDKGPLL